MQEHRFDTGQVVLNYAEGPPNGRPFLVLHGGSGRWQYGEELLERLQPDWHVFAADLRGHGKSGHVAGPYKVANYVPDIQRFLEHVVRDKAVIYGHSLGGEVAVMLAALHPELPRAIIVGDSPLSVRSRATEEPLHRAQNELWHRITGQPEADIVAALKDMVIPVPGGQPRPAREVMGEDSGWFAHQATSLHLPGPPAAGGSRHGQRHDRRRGGTRAAPAATAHARADARPRSSAARAAGRHHRRPGGDRSVPSWPGAPRQSGALVAPGRDSAHWSRLPVTRSFGPLKVTSSADSRFSTTVSPTRTASMAARVSGRKHSIVILSAAKDPLPLDGTVSTSGSLGSYLASG